MFKATTIRTSWCSRLLLGVGLAAASAACGSAPTSSDEPAATTPDAQTPEAKTSEAMCTSLRPICPVGAACVPLPDSTTEGIRMCETCFGTPYPEPCALPLAITNLDVVSTQTTLDAGDGTSTFAVTATVPTGCTPEGTYVLNTGSAQTTPQTLTILPNGTASIPVSGVDMTMTVFVTAWCNGFQNLAVTATQSVQL